MFFNTIGAQGDELIQSEKKTQSQDDLVLWLFRAYNNNGFTPSKVRENLIDLRKISKDVPLTSIRRAMSTLTDKGLLTMTEVKKKGTLGKPEHVWALPKLNIDAEQKELFAA